MADGPTAGEDPQEREQLSRLFTPEVRGAARSLGLSLTRGPWTGDGILRLIFIRGNRGAGMLGRQ